MTPDPERVLVVDDEASVRRMLERWLTDLGYPVALAAHAGEASELLRTGEFALALVDIRMPGVSGMEFLREIVRAHPDTAVVMCTAVVDVETAVESLKLGAYDFVGKPFDLEDVRLRVERALERRRLALENRDYRLNLEGRVEEQTRQIREMFRGAVEALAFALEARDEYTRGHSQRVTGVSVAVARCLGLSPPDGERVRVAGLLHDIGKIGMRDTVLSKPGALDPEEIAHVRAHPVIAERILTPVISDRGIIAAVRHHHERYDGQGYPDGLAGERIPLAARILCAADAYDAMTSNRPYRAAHPREYALAQLQEGAGTQFDPNVTAAIIPVLERNGIHGARDAHANEQRADA
jgi:response regulator RpfG family c-di-GMP phosphodiesterase